MASTSFSARIDDGIRAELEKICDLTDRSKAYITARAIEEYVSRNSWKVEALKKAKQEANQGEFISHQAMDAWINSLGTDQALPAPEIDILKNLYCASCVAEFSKNGFAGYTSLLHRKGLSEHCGKTLAKNICVSRISN